MRDGACKLLAACSQKDQALEAAKSLQTCSTRIMAYMSELQRMKEAQVMQKVTRRSSDAGPMDDRLPCKGKVAISGKSKCFFVVVAWLNLKTAQPKLVFSCLTIEIFYVSVFIYFC